MNEALRTADEELLASLGYKQEFQRAFSALEVSRAFCRAKTSIWMSLLCPPRKSPDGTPELGLKTKVYSGSGNYLHWL